MTFPCTRMLMACLAVLLLCAMPAAAAKAQPKEQEPGSEAFSSEEILRQGHEFFGGATQELASAVEYLFAKQGRPNGYILGEEASGAFIGGLRYGEGTLYTRNAGDHKIFWQGPSIGWDFGAEGAKTMILVYNLKSVDDMYSHFGGIDGSAYLIGGAGVTILASEHVIAAPIRTGVGARLGINVGYLKFTRRPTWNPF